MGVISWTYRSCAGKGSGPLSRNLATAQPEGCRAVLLISGGHRRSNWSWLTSPHWDQQHWNGGGGNAPSSSALPPRRPAISCAIETDAHRQGRLWWRALSDRPFGIRCWSDSNLADQRCTLLQLLPQPVAVERIEASTLLILMRIVHWFAVSGMEIAWRFLFSGSRKFQITLQ
jgi:hypothetical protein